MCCSTCFSCREARFFDVGEAMCWVCRWVRWPLIAVGADRCLWLVDNVFDRRGGQSRDNK